MAMWRHSITDIKTLSSILNDLVNNEIVNKISRMVLLALVLLLTYGLFSLRIPGLPVQLKAFGVIVMSRSARLERNTLETRIQVRLDLDGTGESRLETGLPFLEHMLDQVARHGLIDLDIQAQGDLHIDAHHTVEDLGITLGQAFAKAVGDKKGIRRYGHAYVPLDEALSRVVIDLSGRPGLVLQAGFKRGSIGTFEVDLFHEFFQGFVNHAGVTLHIDSLRGNNDHHIAETMFKAFGRALRVAVETDDRLQGSIPSTKGSL